MNVTRNLQVDTLFVQCYNRFKRVEVCSRRQNHLYVTSWFKVYTFDIARADMMPCFIFIVFQLNRKVSSE